MDVRAIRRVLEQLSKGKLTVPSALERLRGLPFEDLDFARVDHHRELRRGFPEVVLGQGKTIEQIVGITDGIVARGQIALVTRTTREAYEAVRSKHPTAAFNEPARALSVIPKGRRVGRKAGIAVVSAGTTDIPVAEEAAHTAELMGNRVERIYDVGVAGLHRLAAEKDKLLAARVLVVVAGMEGALPSVVAGLVDVPVIAVPTSVGYGAALGGLTALMGMLTSCSTGLTVVNIDNGFGAGYAAALINRLPGRGKG